MIGDLMVALVAAIVGLVLLAVLVVVLVRPPLRRFERARAGLRSMLAERSATLRSLAPARRARR